MNKQKVFFLSSFLFLLFTVNAQKTLIYTEGDAEFKLALELFQKEKYGAAQKSFTKVIATHPNPQSIVRIDAEYYNAICATELFNKDGELFLKEFIKNHPESPKAKTANFYLGKYIFRKKKYREALDWFEKVDIYDLTTEELAEFYFKRGYSYFSTDKMAEAKKDFYEIKDVDNKYASAAKYYHSHISYNEKNYEIALKDFLLLQKNETFGGVVPYYIAQIYYLQGHYEDVITYAPNLLDSARTKRAPEMARIVGESYYRTSRYAEAIPYLKRYEKSANGLQRKDIYQLAYAYYKTDDVEKALAYFIKTTDTDDSLSQNSNYHIADCNLKQKNKQSALTAFGKASKVNYDKSIQEDALYNYAKLCYELSYNPYNEAIKAFQTYLKNYPNSVHKDEAYSYLANVFLTAKSYKEALEAIENISDMTPDLKQSFQKVAYFRGVDLFNNAKYSEAIQSFDKSLKYNFDKEIYANATYWKAECYYRNKKYADAIDNYLEYVTQPGAIGKSEVSDANYNIAYCYYKTGDWQNSILWFRKFVVFKPQADQRKINDALNRIADGYYMNRDYSNAMDYYNQSYIMHLLNADYALFQKAMAEGVLKKYKEKCDDLKLFINNYSTTLSTYVQKAKYELATTYLLDNKNDLALESFKSFLTEYPNSIYENTCLSKVGLIYYNKKEDDNALAYFDKLIKRDRKSPEAINALDNVKMIYTSKGNTDEMQTYLTSVGAAIPQASLDSLAYNIGKNHILEQDCNNAMKDFAKYISKFPNGIFSIQANYYKAECEYRKGNQDTALAEYTFVIRQIKSEYTEQSLVRASELVFKKQNYLLASDYYKQLELIAENPKNNASAVTGFMRCNFKLKDYPNSIVYANKVLAFEKPSAELVNEANYIIASSNFATEKYDEALAQFQALANSLKNAMGAEARYNVAYIQYLKNDFKPSQKTIFELLKESDEQYWVTKAMILLADDYAALKDNFQAKATLNGVITDSDIAELIKIAQDKLAKIIAEEEALKEVKPVNEPLKLEFEGTTPKMNNLFTEPTIISDSTEVKKE